MIVDSCLNEARKNAVALDYLNQLDVDIETQVKLVVVTHWHDDHIRGSAQIVRSAKAARFVCSAALRCTEFFTLVCAGRKASLVEQMSGIAEFSDILVALDRRSDERNLAGPDEWAQEGTRLYYHPMKECPVTVWALSPSAQTITDAKIALARLLPSIGPCPGRLPNPGPNDISTAVLVHTGTTNFLLGSDLEVGNSSSRGWRRILNSGLPELSPPSSVYKIPHHGSENADLAEVWSGLLIADPFAAATPYARGVKPLPSESDVLRLKGRTGKLYITAWPPTKASPNTSASC